MAALAVSNAPAGAAPAKLHCHARSADSTVTGFPAKLLPNWGVGPASAPRAVDACDIANVVANREASHWGASGQFWLRQRPSLKAYWLGATTPKHSHGGRYSVSLGTWKISFKLHGGVGDTYAVVTARPVGRWGGKPRVMFIVA